MVGLPKAANKGAPDVATKPRSAQIMTIISWCTYAGVSSSKRLQPRHQQLICSVSYCVSGTTPRRGAGMTIYQISKAKSEMYADEKGAHA